MVGGVGVQRGGGPGRGVGPRLPGKPHQDDAAAVLQPSGHAVPDARSADREPGRLPGPGGVDGVDRRLQRRGTSLALVQQPSGRPFSLAANIVTPGTVAAHCLHFRPETPFGARGEVGRKAMDDEVWGWLRRIRTEEEWHGCDAPQPLLTYLGRTAGNRKFRLYAAASA